LVIEFDNLRWLFVDCYVLWVKDLIHEGHEAKGKHIKLRGPSWMFAALGLGTIHK